MNLRQLTEIARKAIVIAMPMLPEEHTTLTLRYTGQAQDVAYSPELGWPTQSTPVEYQLSGVLVLNTVREDVYGGAATAIEQQTFKAVFSDLPLELQALLRTQQGVDDLCRIDGGWLALLQNGGILRIHTVTLAGPMVSLAMRKVG